VHLDFQLTGLGAGCNPFTPSAAGTIDLDATFLVRHPYLESYGTYVMRHDGANRMPLHLQPATVPPTLAEATFSPSAPIWLDPSSLNGAAERTGYAVEPCSYEAGIVAQARLTTGASKIHPAGPAKKSFCVR
jgi:hypothetical protein